MSSIPAQGRMLKDGDFVGTHHHVPVFPPRDGSTSVQQEGQQTASVLDSAAIGALEKGNCGRNPEVICSAPFTCSLLLLRAPGKRVGQTRVSLSAGIRGWEHMEMEVSEGTSTKIPGHKVTKHLCVLHS